MYVLIFTYIPKDLYIKYGICLIMENYGKFNEEVEYAKINIDLKDRKILSLLSINSRTPLTEIAKKVKLSRDTVNYRINRLIKNKVILRFYPIISLKKFGYSLFHVFMLLDETKKEQRQQFINHLKKSQYTISLIEYSDRWDFEIVIAAKNLKQFDVLITSLISAYPNLIVEKDKYQVIKSYHFNPLPKGYLAYEDIYYEKEDDVIVEIDQIDKNILGLLCEDCRASTYEMSSKLNISPDTISYRIKNLIKKDIIKKFTILVNLSLLNYHWYTFAAQIKVLGQEQESKLITYVKYNPQIIRAMKVLGTWDIVMYIVATNPRDFHSTIKEIKNNFANIILNYQSWGGYKEHFFIPFPRIVCEE